MTTATKTRKATKQQPRSAKLLILSNGYKVLCLTIGDDLQSYGLTPLPSDFGVAYHLLKADRGDGPGEEYDVLLNGQQSSCTCKGNTYRGHCKHVEALTALVQSDKLVAPPVASKPEPRPEPECCFNCDLPLEACKCFI